MISGVGYQQKSATRCEPYIYFFLEINISAMRIFKSCNAMLNAQHAVGGDIPDLTQGPQSFTHLPVYCYVISLSYGM